MQIHLNLSKEPSLFLADRYRHLAAHHILKRDFKHANQALWASHLDLNKFTPLAKLKDVLGEQEEPQWLISPPWGARFPASLSAEETVGQREWVDHHLRLADMCLSKETRWLHVIVLNVFLGFYGFAVEAMYAYETRDDVFKVPDDYFEMLEFTQKMLDTPMDPVNYPWQHPWR